MAREVLYRVIYGSTNIADKPNALAKAAKLSIHDAILHDYCRHRVAHADYPGMVPQKGASVRGTYVAGLTDGDIRNLDWFEGSEYVKERVRPFLLKPDGMNGGLREAERVDAETYIFTGGFGRLEEAEWDFEHFRKEKMQNWADYSEEYAGEFTRWFIYLYFCLLTGSRS
jgi:hypothetical protein